MLVNPWIYDFAAVNLWARPLGLLKVAEYLSQFDVSFILIDCMDSFKDRIYGTGKYNRTIVKKPPLLKDIPRYYKRYGISIDTFTEKVKNNLPVDLIVVSSIMSYWYPGVQKVIEILKECSPQTPIILGGIYATLYHDHASKNTSADLIFTGPVDKKISIELARLGYTLRQISSKKKYYDLNLYHSYPFAPLLTSRGVSLSV